MNASDRTSAPPAAAAAGAEAGSARLSILLPIFMLTLVLPIVFEAGGLRLSPYRILLMATIVPTLAMLLSGKAGAINRIDILVLIYGVWIVLSFFVNHGLERLPYATITAIEAVGPYLLARLFIRTAKQFEAWVKLLLLIMLILLPFCAYEALTGSRVLSRLFDMGFTTFGIAHQEKRWGMTRAQATFEHPILLGVFASTAYGLAYYVLGATREQRGRFWAVIGGGVTFFSLSMGAFLSGMVQTGLMVYDRITRGTQGRWRKLIIATIAAYVFVDLASNRGPVVIFIQSLTFNSMAAWTRIGTWQYGTEVVIAYPVFGIGLKDWSWARPSWLTSSVDNFWLLNAMRYGMPGTLALCAAVFLTMTGVGRQRFEDRLGIGCQRGYIIVMAGLCFALCTVHAWNALFCYVMFLIGSGSWMMERQRRTRSAPEPEPPASPDGDGPEPEAIPVHRPRPRPGALGAAPRNARRQPTSRPPRRAAKPSARR